MPRTCLDGTSGWIGPQRVRASFALEVATVLPEVAKEVPTLHPTTTFPQRAVAGTPRRPSLRRSSRMRAIALARLFSTAGFVFLDLLTSLDLLLRPPTMRKLQLDSGSHINGARQRRPFAGRRWTRWLRVGAWEATEIDTAAALAID